MASLATLVTLLGLTAISFAAPLAQRKDPPTYSGVVAFGDSFSDNGNEYHLSNETWPADPAYYGGRFSNGPVWVERLAANLSVPLHDYAYGGATTSNALVQGYSGKGGTIPVPSLDQQLDSFLSNPPTPLNSTLFAIFGGANDILFNPNVTAVQPAGVISGLITKLRNQGAQNFLLLNYPDLSMIPYDSYIPLPTQFQLRDFSSQLNTELTSLTSSLVDSGSSPTSPTTSTPVSATYVNLIPLFETFGFYEGGWKAAGFDPFGLYGSCLVGAYVEVPQRTLCSNPDQHVFWDEFHPTGVGHELIASTILSALADTS